MPPAGWASPSSTMTSAPPASSRRTSAALGGDLDDLCLGHVGGWAAPDGEPYPGPGVRIMAIHNDLHGTGCYRPGGSGHEGLRVVVIMAPWRQQLLRWPRAPPRAGPTSSAWGQSSGCPPSSCSSRPSLPCTSPSARWTRAWASPGRWRTWTCRSPRPTRSCCCCPASPASSGVFAVERGQIRRVGSIFNLAKWGLREWYVLSFLMGLYFVLRPGLRVPRPDQQAARDAVGAPTTARSSS